MITLLTGKKGSGKTKKLIELANAALETSKGCVVVIEKGLKLTYDISHAARLVDADAYKFKVLICCLALSVEFVQATMMLRIF